MTDARKVLRQGNAMTTKQCHRCRRLGTQQFVPWGSEGWECSNDRACTRRLARALGSTNA